MQRFHFSRNERSNGCAVLLNLNFAQFYNQLYSFFALQIQQNGTKQVQKSKTAQKFQKMGQKIFKKSEIAHISNQTVQKFKKFSVRVS